MSDHCCHQSKSDPGSPAQFIKDPWIWSLALVAAAWLASVSGTPLTSAGHHYLRYFAMMMPPILLGILLGGMIQHWMPNAYITRLLSGSGPAVILKATFLGFLASACSHGCLAIAIAIYRKGAPVPAVIAFLLASPWANLALTVLLLSLFGVGGIAIVVSAFVIALLTGLAFLYLSRRGWIEKNPEQTQIEPGFSIRKDIARRWKAFEFTRPEISQEIKEVGKSSISLGRMLLGWVQLGLVSVVLINLFVSDQWMAHWFGASWTGLFATLGAATIIEVCSEGTAPIAFELYQTTGALGNAFVFLMAGVVTDITEIGALAGNIGKKTPIWMLLIAIPLVIVTGKLMNLLF